MDEQAQSPLMCPKDGAEMQRMGRGRGPHRCPQCRGIFLDVAEMRSRRAERKPQPFAIAGRVIVNVIVSVAISVAVSRWVKRRKENKASQEAAAA